MHEISIMSGIFDIVLNQADQNRLKNISAINVVVGELSGVEPAALHFAFSCFAKNTLAEGAEFTVTPVKPTGRCRRCSTSLEGISGLTCRCAEGPDYEMLTGTELYVNTITGESKLEE